MGRKAYPNVCHIREVTVRFFPKAERELLFVGVKRYPVNEVELEKCVFFRPPLLIVVSSSRF